MQCGEYQTAHTSTIVALAFSPNGNFIASGSHDRTVQVWDSETAPPISLPPMEREKGNRSWPIVSSSDGKVLASWDSDKYVRLWDLKTGELLKELLKDEKENSLSLAFSSDGAIVASGFDDGTVCLWDTEAWTLLGSPLKCHNKGVTSIAFSADGKVMVSGSSHGEIRVWDLASWTPIGQLQNELELPISSLTWSPDGQLIAFHNFGKVTLLDARTYSPVGRLEQELKLPRSLQFLPDQKLLVTGHDWTVQYDLVTFQECKIDTNVGYRTYGLFPDQVRFLPMTGSWMSFLSQPLFWFPPQHGPDVVIGTLTYCGRLAFITRSYEFFSLGCFSIPQSLSFILYVCNFLYRAPR